MQYPMEWMVGVVRRLLNRSLVYDILGTFLISVGIVLACFLAVHSVRGVVDGWIVQQSSYLLIASTPVFDLPPATPLPTPTTTPLPTLTPTPTPTPLPPLPAIRLSIPAIDLNTSIQEISPIEKTTWNRETIFEWETTAFSVGHYSTSGNPGGGTNIVLTGHNNISGEVFRDLDKLHPGDEVILFTEDSEFYYEVQKVYTIPYLGVETEGEATIQSLTAPQTSEMVTMVSCWPYATSSHRIIVIAVPASDEDENDN